MKRFPAIPDVGNDLESVAAAVRELRDAMHILTGATQDKGSRAVLVDDIYPECIKKNNQTSPFDN